MGKGKGRWVASVQMRRCSGARRCNACLANPSAKPHGPYTYLRRRNPVSGKQESLYLGSVVVGEAVLDAVNKAFSGNERPSRKVVVDLLDNLP